MYINYFKRGNGIPSCGKIRGKTVENLPALSFLPFFFVYQEWR